ncbi:MAG: endonuclease Q family protein [Elusimicrobiota bacterium]
MKLIADLHIHSKYSRATSGDMDIPNIAKWAKLKGIALMGTGDFTHPKWLEHLKENLKETDGCYEHNSIKFILTAEVSNIYTRTDKTRKVHNIIFAPDFETVEKINTELAGFGNLESDGRPMLSLDSEDLAKIVFDISDDCMIIPAHAWTPHFSVFGSNSGFNSLEECFGYYTDRIYSIETGLSSDPKMNWRLSQLDKITLISNSDAHSPKNIGREANVFDVTNYTNLYEQITRIIRTKDKDKFLYTIEFFPEEGKYHYDGHRNCDTVLAPKDAIKNHNLCPNCERRLTIGVLHRVEELADREENFQPVNAIGYKSLIPLREIIADALDIGKESAGVDKEYQQITSQVGTEFDVLLEIPEEILQKNIRTEIAEGIIKVRNGEVDIQAGYDGVYGKISIRKDKKQEQLSLF